MPKTIPCEIAVTLLAGSSVQRTDLTRALDVNSGIAEALQVFAERHSRVVERSTRKNRTSYVCREATETEIAGTLIEVDDGHIIYPPGRRRRRYFAATDGAITIWRSVGSVTKVYRSVVMRPFTLQWRSARPSGPGSYPTVQITNAMADELWAAKSRAPSTDDELCIANRYLPASVRDALSVSAGDTRTLEEAGA